jgi:hypothetical protein
MSYSRPQYYDYGGASSLVNRDATLGSMPSSFCTMSSRDGLDHSSVRTPLAANSYQSTAFYTVQRCKDSNADANLETDVGDESTTRSTPNSLDWIPNSDLLKLYSFIVKKSREPYFELQSPYFPTFETPSRVYLDHPQYVERIMSLRGNVLTFLAG